MDPHAGAMLVAAGIVGGTISSLVGGAAIVTFPALIATGLDPVVATATNLVALVPGNFLASLYDRTQLPPLDRAFAGLLAASLLGAAGGAILLMLTPASLFAAFVPALLAFATVLFAYARRLSDWIHARAAAQGGAANRWSGSAAALLPVSVYAGCFGGRAGVMLLAVLSVGPRGRYRAAHVTNSVGPC